MNELPPTQPAQASDDLAIPETGGDIETMNRLRLTSCPDCGTVFALPLDLYLEKMHNAGHIYCPAGHLIELKQPNEHRAEPLLLQVQLLAEVRQARYERDTLKNTLARMPRPASDAISDEELQRRVRYIVNRASRTEFGKLICRFCEMVSRTNSSLNLHLKRNHKADIEGMPSSYFDEA